MNLFILLTSIVLLLSYLKIRKTEWFKKYQADREKNKQFEKLYRFYNQKSLIN